MKAPDSEYISRKKPVAEELLERLLDEFGYASVLVEDRCGTNRNVSSSGDSSDVSDVSTQRGYSVRVYNGHGYAEAAGNMLEKEHFPALIEELRSMCTDEGNETAPEDPCLRGRYYTELDNLPAEAGDKLILERMRDIRCEALSFDSAVADCSVMTLDREVHQLFLSPNRDLEQHIHTFSTMADVTAGPDGRMHQLFRSSGGVGGVELMDNIRPLLPGLVADTLLLSDCEAIEPGTYTCICSPDVSGLIAHESLGHGVEADMFVKKRALAENYIGRQIASPLVSMVDSASLPRAGFYYFDDEGYMAQRTVIIDRGILVSPVADQISAGRLGLSGTGNGRRQDYSHRTYSRMTNTWFEGGCDSLDDMIGSTRHGFLLDYIDGGMEDPRNWGIQCVASLAREIKDGHFTGRVCSPVIITGYVPDMLKSVDMVSGNVEFSGASSCGKGFKERVTVSTGGPWMRARLHLG